MIGHQHLLKYIAILFLGNSTQHYGRKRIKKINPIYDALSTSCHKIHLGIEKEKFFFSDIFDFEVKKEILNKIQNMTSEKDNPNLIGYFWTDMPMWNLKKIKRKVWF